MLNKWLISFSLCVLSQEELKWRSLQGYHHFLHIHTTHLIHQKNGWSVGWLLIGLHLLTGSGGPWRKKKTLWLTDGFLNYWINWVPTKHCSEIKIDNKLNLVCNLLEPWDIIQEPGELDSVIQLTQTFVKYILTFWIRFKCIYINKRISSYLYSYGGFCWGLF